MHGQVLALNRKGFGLGSRPRLFRLEKSPEHISNQGFAVLQFAAQLRYVH